MPSSIHGMTLAAAVWAAVAGLPQATSANDATATLKSEGLELISNPWIKMEEEELRIEPKQITVRYLFRNTSDRDRTLIVAFPLPDIDGEVLVGEGVVLANEQSDNFVDFKVWIDGVAITPMIERRAFAGGFDVTEDLRREGIPLMPYRADDSAIMKLSPDRIRDFEERGILRVSGPDDIQTIWTLKTKFYWRQTFPKDRPVVIEHKYVPVAGLGFYSTDSLEYDPWLRTDYCLSADVERKAAAVLMGLPKGEDDPDPYLHRRLVQYILTTANTWQDSIGVFRLIIETNSADRFASTCFEGLRQVGPTRYEFSATDFRPSRELKALFIERIEE